MTTTLPTPTISRNPVAAACRVAAALLEEHGWCPRIAHDDEDRYDVIGALEAATHGGHTHVDPIDPADVRTDTPDNAVYRQALTRLHWAGWLHYHCMNLPLVNDFYIGSTAEAVALLLEAAEQDEAVQL